MNLLVSMRYLVALDEHKHFGRAAQASHVTQPALSNAIRALEEDLGMAVVKRGRTFIGFTPEGERLLQSARRMLREEALLREELGQARDSVHGRLILGVVPTAEPVAARFAAQLHSLHPGITPVVRSLSSQEIEHGLDDLALDMGLGFLSRQRTGLRPWQTLPVYEEQYFLVRQNTKSGSRLRMAEPIRWNEAASLPLCLLTPEMHHRSIVDEVFAGSGAQAQPMLETNSLLTLALSAVGTPVCSIMPGALLDLVRGYGELQAHPLIDPQLRTPMGFMVLPVDRFSRPLQAALALAQAPSWLQQIQALGAH